MVLRSKSDEVGQFWDRRVDAGEKRVNWWSSDKCTAYYNEGVSGESVPGNSEGCRRVLRQKLRAGAIRSGVSIGCGAGSKELSLVKQGLVGKMHLWDLSQERLARARSAAQEEGLSEKISTNHGDAFQQEQDLFDLVYWDHSLHHMDDPYTALQWSLDHLTPGGWLLINDYFGPNRLQWSRSEVDRCNRFLKKLQSEHGVALPSVPYSNPLSRLRMWRRDPSEAPKSEEIASAVAKVLGTPDAITRIGGTILNILGGVVVPRFDDSHSAIDDLVAEDRAALKDGHWHFGFVLWQKPA